MIRAEDVNINIDEMEIVKMPQKRTNKRTVTVNEQGFLTINSLFLKELETMYPSFNTEFRCSQDARFIAFREPQQYRFTIIKTGRFKHEDFVMKLKHQGYKFPAQYSVAWNVNLNAWIGVLQEVEKAPSARSLVRNKARRPAVKGSANG